MKKLTLESLPVSSTIRFMRNGKEHYLRKIRIGGRYFSSWYDPIRCESVKESSLPKNWQML